MFTTYFALIASRRARRTLAGTLTLFAAFLVMILPIGAAAEDNDSFTAEVIRLVNAERAKVGAPALREEEELIPAANLRAQEASSKFSHTRPNGSMWKTVFNEFEILSSYRGENLAYGQRSPSAVVQAWMASEGHRKNILNDAFDHIAVGLYEKDGVLYWSQLFIQTANYSVPAGAPVVAGQNAQVIDVDLHVRSSADAQAAVVAVAAKGSALVVLEVEQDWARVQLSDGTDGWVRLRYLAA